MICMQKLNRQDFYTGHEAEYNPASVVNGNMKNLKMISTGKEENFACLAR